jgi:hypothetical protein
MATKNPSIPLSRTELVFWRQAFLAAEISVLLGKRSPLNPTGAAHLAAEFADAAVREFRNTKNGERK